MSSREDWMRRLGPLYGGAVALVHSTPWRWPSAIVDEPRSAGWVVALALPTGAFAGAVAALALAIGVPIAVAAVIATAAMVFASAALIERGVVERIDHWRGKADDGSLAASAHGASTAASTVALLVLVLMTALRITAIASVASDRWLAVLVATAVLGRWCAVFLQVLGDPVTDDHAPRSLVAAPAPVWLVGALGAVALACLIVALGTRAGITALALSAAATFALGIEAERRDHGLSAPVIATAAAVGELLVLLLAATPG